MKQKYINGHQLYSRSNTKNINYSKYHDGKPLIDINDGNIITGIIGKRFIKSRKKKKKMDYLDLLWMNIMKRNLVNFWLMHKD